MDNRMSWTQVKAFWKIYKKNWKKFKAPVNTFGNWVNRHEGYELQRCFVEIDGIRVGFTPAICTSTDKKALKFNQDMNPYTPEGRKMYYEKRVHSQAKEPRCRPTLYDPNDLYILTMSSEKGKSIYNFEYFMNREYAYNRDKGKCTCCKKGLIASEVRTHHKNPRLPLGKINKVSNLATICQRCHTLVHKTTVIKAEDCINKIHLDKINKLRGLLGLTN